MELKACFLKPSGEECTETLLFRASAANCASEFHQSMPEYRPTQLKSLPNLAQMLGIGGLYVKDESSRFGLNAFKGLGGSYCIAQYIARKFGLDSEKLTYAQIQEIRESGRLSGMTVATATDGNHGRGLAWAANQLGIACRVFMPKGSARERVENIRKQNAEVLVTELNYDDTVRMACRLAEENGWVLMQDTTVPGHEEIPIWLMRGYTTMAEEIFRQWDGDGPTHILLQAGVGSMAGAMAVCLSDLFRASNPEIIVVEADQADCIYRTALADDGTLHTVGGDLATIMAGLACGEPCEIAWKLMRETAGCYLSVSDSVTEEGMRRLAKPLGEDPAIESGESGAVTTGVVIRLMTDDAYADIRERLHLGADSRVLVISTEGATNRENYERVLAGN